MDFVITFFRDILVGPTYIATTVVASILFCACIGYLAEKSINNKKNKLKDKEKNTKSVVEEPPLLKKDTLENKQPNQPVNGIKSVESVAKANNQTINTNKAVNQINQPTTNKTVEQAVANNQVVNTNKAVNQINQPLNKPVVTTNKIVGQPINNQVVNTSNVVPKTKQTTENTKNSVINIVTNQNEVIPPLNKVPDTNNQIKPIQEIKQNTIPLPKA